MLPGTSCNATWSTYDADGFALSANESPGRDALSQVPQLETTFDDLRPASPVTARVTPLDSPITDHEVIVKILDHLGLPSEPPQVTPARTPPHHGDDGMTEW